MSDIHLNDGTIGESVSDSELTGRLLAALHNRETRTELVFLGDIFEMLRSTEWAALWKPEAKVAPWTNMGQEFKNFPPLAAKASLTILKRIIARYPQFAETLNRLTSAGKVRTRYIPGNHDYMVQLSAEARKLVREFLSTEDKGSADRFLTHYSDDQAEIYAVHGNRADPLNWHDEPTGRWAYGDAIVLRLVNVFVTEACGRAGIDPASPETPIGQSYQDMDNIQPSSDLALYFRYSLEGQLTNGEQRQEVLKLWRDAVDGLLNLKAFADETLYGDRTHKFMRYALKLSKELTLAALAPELREKYELLFKGEDPYLALAQNLFESLDGKYRYILFGHTHQPLVMQLAGPENRHAYYVNTGCWRRLVIRGTNVNSFRPMRVRSWFEVEGGSRPFTYRLVRELDTQ